MVVEIHIFQLSVNNEQLITFVLENTLKQVRFVNMMFRKSYKFDYHSCAYACESRCYSYSKGTQWKRMFIWHQS